MAIESFFTHVVIEDEEKIEEILEVLKQPMKRDIKPTISDKLPENAVKIWFKNKE